MLDAKWGRIYDQIFESRQSGDYLELYEFEAVQVIEMLTQAEGFIKEMKRLYCQLKRTFIVRLRRWKYFPRIPNSFGSFLLIARMSASVAGSMARAM